MKIIQRISVNTSDQLKQQIQSLGIQATYGPILTSFEMDESDERWGDVRSIVKEFNGLCIPSTHFSKKDLKQAEYLQMVPAWHHGYPQPDENNFGYWEATYNTENKCDQCGAGAVQVNPFWMSREPKWGKRSILQLNWVFDEFFASPIVWNEVFKPFGISSLPVLDAKGQRELKTVVQLQFIEKECSLDIREYPKNVCPNCSVSVCLPITRQFPKVEPPPKSHAFRTREYFGSGASASTAIIVSQDLFGKIQGMKIKGVNFVPCQSS